jgi:hypothetical protein
VKSRLHLVQVAEAEEPRGVQMPEHVQLSLVGIAGQAKDGLLALAVSTGRPSSRVAGLLNETR